MNLFDVVTAPWALGRVHLDAVQGQAMAFIADVAAGASVPTVKAPMLNPEPAIRDGIAIVEMVGITVPNPHPLMRLILGATCTVQIAHQISDLARDSDVRAIALLIDSPGGSVNGTETLRNVIAAANNMKPVVGIIEGTCLSAACWAASACRSLHATEEGALVGGLGVYLTHTDLSERAAMQGLRRTDIVAGRYKRSAGPNAPLSEDGRGQLQSLVDGIYRVMICAVAQGRRTTPAAAHEQMGDGREFLASEARRRGLIDGIADMGAVLATMRKALPA